MSIARNLKRGRLSATSTGRPVAMSTLVAQLMGTNDLAEMSWPLFRFRT
jgi:hypothetical protein